MTLRQRRQAAMTESLHHMTACLTYYLARVLRTWHQRQAASSVNETGRRLLAIDLSNVATDSKTGDLQGGEPSGKDLLSRNLVLSTSNI